MLPIAVVLAVLMQKAPGPGELALTDPFAGSALTLHQRALRSGGHYTLYTDAGYEDIDDMSLELLVKESEAIVVGRAGRLLPSVVSLDGRNITTHFKMMVSRVLKGPIQPNRTITLARPGGRVRFSDGSVAEVLLRGPFKIPAGDQEYVLFLRQDPKSGDWWCTGGPQGAFEVLPKKKLEALDYRPEARVAAQYKGRDLDSFLRDIAKATATTRPPKAP